jgi:flagellar hook protein FlgE
MLRSLTSGVSGLQAFQEEMDVIGNNIANVNTTAFKSARTEFADTFSDTLRQSTAGTATSSGATATQVGTGVTTAAITNNFDQGVMNRTGFDSDLMINGNGFFVVRDTVSNVDYVTRAGNFHRDNNGYLVTATGERVQGLSDAGLTTSGDIQIDTTGMPTTSSPTATMLSWSVDPSGQIVVKLSDGTSFVRGQILMQNFMNPNGLEKQGNNLYSGQTAAGPIGGMSPAGSNGLGSIQGGALELSNVDLANEMANLITAQRAFEANAKIITTSDEMLQAVVNLKR